MVAILSASVALFAFRFRSRAALELKLVALQHQLAVLRRQRPGRPQLSSLDRFLWVLLCSTGSGPRSSMRWYWSSPQPWSSGIARVSGSIGAGDHVVRDDPRSVQTSVI